MKKDIKDYLHLYLGCEVHDFVNDKAGRLFRVSTNGVCKVLHNVQWSLHPHEFKLILRPLSDMTEEEIDDLSELGFEIEENGGLPVNIWKGVNMSGHVLWLLSKGFDLFNLIQEGLAIDATTLKKEV